MKLHPVIHAAFPLVSDAGAPVLRGANLLLRSLDTTPYAPTCQYICLGETNQQIVLGWDDVAGDVVAATVFSDHTVEVSYDPVHGEEELHPTLASACTSIVSAASVHSPELLDALASHRGKVEMRSVQGAQHVLSWVEDLGGHPKCVTIDQMGCAWVHVARFDAREPGVVQCLGSGMFNVGGLLVRGKSQCVAALRARRMVS